MQSIDELIADSQALIDGYLDPYDREQLYNRIWHCLKWQQVDPDNRIMEILRRLYRLFRQTMPLEQRRVMYLAARNEVHERRFVPSVFVVFMQNEVDEGIASTATIDLLAYSILDENSLPIGLRALAGIIEHRLCAMPGALFSAAVSFGDSNLTDSLNAMGAHLTAQDIQLAARMQTGFVNHATVQYWISVARALAEREDEFAQCVVGSCASALVRIYQIADQPIVFDFERLYPASEYEPATRIKQSWPIRDYGLLIDGQIVDILQAESGPKIFGKVRQVWRGESEMLASDSNNHDPSAWGR